MDSSYDELDHGGVGDVFADAPGSVSALTAGEYRVGLSDPAYGYLDHTLSGPDVDVFALGELAPGAYRLNISYEPIYGTPNGSYSFGIGSVAFSDRYGVVDGSEVGHGAYSSAYLETITGEPLYAVVSGVADYSAAYSVSLSRLPMPPADTDPTPDEVPEYVVDGTPVGLVLAGSDPSGDGTRFSLTDDAGGRFTVDPVTGQVTVADASLIAGEGGLVHQITARVTDAVGGMNHQTFSVSITDRALLPVTDDDDSPDQVSEVTEPDQEVGIRAVSGDPAFVLGGPPYDLFTSALDGSTGVGSQDHVTAVLSRDGSRLLVFTERSGTGSGDWAFELRDTEAGTSRWVDLPAGVTRAHHDQLPDSNETGMVELLGVTDDGQAAIVAIRNPDTSILAGADAAGIYRVSVDGDGLDPVRVDLWPDGSPLVDTDPGGSSSVTPNFDMSGDGSVLVFGLRVSDDGAGDDSALYYRDLDGNQTVRLNPPGGESVGVIQSMDPAVSTDGSVVYFRSANPVIEDILEPAVDYDGIQGVSDFIYHASTGELRQANIGPDGAAFDTSFTAYLSSDGSTLVTMAWDEDSVQHIVSVDTETAAAEFTDLDAVWARFGPDSFDLSGVSPDGRSVVGNVWGQGIRMELGDGSLVGLDIRSYGGKTAWGENGTLVWSGEHGDLMTGTLTGAMPLSIPARSDAVVMSRDGSVLLSAEQSATGAWELVTRTDGEVTARVGLPTDVRPAEYESAGAQMNMGSFSLLGVTDDGGAAFLGVPHYDWDDIATEGLDHLPGMSDGGVYRVDLSDLSATRVDLDASGEPLFSYDPADATYWDPSNNSTTDFAMSGDGTVLAFAVPVGSSSRSGSEDSVAYYLSDLSAGTVTHLNDGTVAASFNTGWGGLSPSLQLSADGTVAVFASNHELTDDLRIPEGFATPGNLFSYDSSTGTYRQVNLDHEGVAFESHNRQHLSGDGATLVTNHWFYEENHIERHVLLQTSVADGSVEVIEPLTPDGSPSGQEPV